MQRRSGVTNADEISDVPNVDVNPQDGEAESQIAPTQMSIDTTGLILHDEWPVWRLVPARVPASTKFWKTHRLL